MNALDHHYPDPYASFLALLAPLQGLELASRVASATTTCLQAASINDSRQNGGGIAEGWGGFLVGFPTAWRSQSFAGR